MLQTVIQNPTWWKRRTALERKLIVLTVAVIIFAVALTAATVALIIQDSKDDAPSLNSSFAEASRWDDDFYRKSKSSFPFRGDSKRVCTTPGCVRTAAKVLEYIDETAEPCDDFYDFACGKFIKETQIPDDKTAVTAFSVISDKLKDQLKSIIEEPIKEDDSHPYVIAKNLYKSCMNKTRINERGVEPLMDILRKLGGWPLLDGDNWKEENFKWTETIYKFRETGYSVDYILDFSVSTNYKNSSYRVIDFDQPSLGLSREYLIKGANEKIVQGYYTLQVDVAVMMGADRARAEKEMMDALLFEIQLANISLPNEERRNATKLYNPMTLGELQLKNPSIPWLEYVNKLLPKHLSVTEDEVVVVNVPSYITGVEQILQNTPKRVLANYLMWKVVGSSISYLPDKYRDRELVFEKLVFGKEQREARWKECVRYANGGASLAIGSLYVKRYFNEDAKKSALEMVQEIRAQFREILGDLEWMDDKTRKEAIEKADSMVTHIGYPDELMDAKKLEEFYKNLQVNPGLFLESVLNLTKFGTEFSFGRLRTPVNKTEWIAHGRPAVVNAFYSGIENSIQFPAGILQGLFFSHDRPKYMNYGAIGFVIGHEITHGFDDQGRQFDKNGNLVDWWAKETESKFLKKAECIIHQYGNYTAEEVGIKLNGINTQGENIADNGGIKEAYRAYLQWTKRNGEEPMLPGLPYTPRQLFWISAANTWCSKYRPETLKLRIVTGVHSPGRFRVIGPFSNMEEFARDFKCPLGTKMNPVEKCVVW